MKNDSDVNKHKIAHSHSNIMAVQCSVEVPSLATWHDYRLGSSWRTTNSLIFRNPLPSLGSPLPCDNTGRSHKCAHTCMFPGRCVTTKISSPTYIMNFKTLIKPAVKNPALFTTWWFCGVSFHVDVFVWARQIKGNYLQRRYYHNIGTWFDSWIRCYSTMHCKEV